MSEQFNLTPEEIEMERQLGALAPKTPPIDEHAIWFEAGVRRGRKSEYRWQIATAASLALAIGSFSWNAQSRPSVVQRPRTQPTTIASVAHGPDDTRRASRSVSAEHEGIDDLLKASGWRLQADEPRQTQSPAAGPSGTLSVSQMLERSTNPKDFLTMRS